MFRITGFVVAIAGFLALAVSGAAAKGDAVALVVGNSSYAQAELENPLNDAAAMSVVLESAGFEVMTLMDADAGQLRTAMAAFRNRLTQESTGFVYLAGHGAEIAGRTYFLATDSRSDSPASLKATAVSIADLLDNTIAGKTYILLDICRTDPFMGAAADTSSARAEIGDSLPKGATVAFASGPAQAANDGARGHGLFTQALLRALQASPASMTDALHQASAEVRRVTSGRQTPVVYSSPGSRVTGTDAALTSPVLAELDIALLEPAPGRNRGILPKSSSAQHDLEFWNAIKDSTNPADYEAYLESFPEGSFAPLARLRVRQFSRPDEANEESEPGFEVEDMEAPYVVLTNANVRAQPTANSDKVGELTQGSPVTVTGHVVDANWYRVRVEGGTGYVFGDLIRSAIVATEPPKTSAETAPASTVAKQDKSTPEAAPTTTSKAAGTEVSVTARKAPQARADAVAGLPRSSQDQGGSGLQDCDLCPELVRIEPGSFTMGSNSGDDHERPEIKVTINKPFAIGKYEVTIGQWEACAVDGGCSYNPKRKSGQSDRMPMRNLSWFDAMEYVTWLSKKTGRPYRLPSEAEWEYVARAGTTTRYWWGSEIGNGRVDCESCGSDWTRRNPPEAGSFAPNPFGVYDTSGSVWEWTADCWTDSHDGAPRDESVRSKTDCRQRVLRGGSWRHEPEYLRSASRYNYDAHVRYLPHGFRVAAGAR